MRRAHKDLSPEIYVMYRHNDEANSHLYLHCLVACGLWNCWGRMGVSHLGRRIVAYPVQRFCGKEACLDALEVRD